MNWFTSNIIVQYSAKRKQELIEQDGGCEHVEHNPELAYAVKRENDSFGVVGQYVVCQACDKKVDEEEGNVEHVCNDCKQTFKAKDGIAWKWYDFYAASGDKPLFVCKACEGEKKHKSRVEKDRLDYEMEFGDADS